MAAVGMTLFALVILMACMRDNRPKHSRYEYRRDKW
jgi:hypothetical protein